MRFIGIVPARMASTRFPGKPLALIGGEPMLFHIWRAVLRTRTLWPRFVATPDREIAEACQGAGIPYVMTAYSCRSGTERCQDAMRQLAMRDPDDVVVNVQGDEPTIRPESLEALTAVFENPTVRIASLYFTSSNPNFVADPNQVKVLVDNEGNAAEFVRVAKIPWLWKKHVGVYAYRRDVLARLAGLELIGDLEQDSWMMAGHKIRMVEIPYETIAVDAPTDIAKIEENRPKTGLGHFLLIGIWPNPTNSLPI